MVERVERNSSRWLGMCILWALSGVSECRHACVRFVRGRILARRIVAQADDAAKEGVVIRRVALNALYAPALSADRVVIFNRLHGGVPLFCGPVPRVGCGVVVPAYDPVRAVSFASPVFASVSAMGAGDRPIRSPEITLRAMPFFPVHLHRRRSPMRS